MRLQRLLVVLTVVDLRLLVLLLAQIHPVGAQEVAPVVRTHALDIVDERGTVRAGIKVEESETAILRMNDKNGRIRVQLGADSGGSGLNLNNNSRLLGCVATRARCCKGRAGPVPPVIRRELSRLVQNISRRRTHQFTLGRVS
jgi:hypothetical protein